MRWRSYVADPAEKPIVDKFGVRGAPMPLVLAIAPTGAATRAFPKQFDEAQFQQAFVSPCTAKCMRAIQDRHLILLCVQNGKTQFNQEAMQGVEAFKADPQYAKGTEVVTLESDRQGGTAVPQGPSGRSADHHGGHSPGDAARCSGRPLCRGGDQGGDRGQAQGGAIELLPRREVRSRRLLPQVTGGSIHAIANACLARDFRAQEPTAYQLPGDPAGNHGDRVDQEHLLLLREGRRSGDGFLGGQRAGAPQVVHVAGLLRGRHAGRDDPRGIRHATGDVGPGRARQHLARSCRCRSNCRARPSRSPASCPRASSRPRPPGAGRASSRGPSAAGPRSA